VAEKTAGPARGSENGFLSGWQKIAVGLCVALPVPVFAGTGLALPLPSVVYRLAVAAAARTEAVAVQLSGFKVVTAQDAATARLGTIRLTESEREAAGSAADPAPAGPGSARLGSKSTARSTGTAHLTAAVSRGKSSPKLGGDAAVTVREAAPVLDAPATEAPAPKDPGKEGGSTSNPPHAPAASGEPDGRDNGSEGKEKGRRSDGDPDKGKPAQTDKGPAKGESPEPGQGQGEPQKDKPKGQEDPQADVPAQDESETPGNGQGGAEEPGHGNGNGKGQDGSDGGALNPDDGQGTGDDGSNGGGSDKTPPGKAG
jgi:hypothetical protein